MRIPAVISGEAPPKSILFEEENFSLEFSTLHCPVESCRPVLWDAGIDNVYTLQKRIILPGRLPMAANGSASPERSIQPLMMTGGPENVAGCSTIAVIPKNEKVRVTQTSRWTKVSDEGMDILFSSPFICYGNGTIEAVKELFGEIGACLEESGMQGAGIARTWLYMRDILGDYDLLNGARGPFFAGRKLCGQGFLPASTGIQGRIAGNAFMSLEFCAFSGDRIAAEKIASPLQNEPTDYGKLFSRAVKVSFPSGEIIFISGTASIDKAGVSVQAGSLNRQLRHTCDVILTLLQDNGCDFSAIAQSVLYLKKNEYLTESMMILTDLGFPLARTLIITNSDVCRPELLCEIEVIALNTRKVAGG